MTTVKTYICDICGKRFDSRKMAASHEKQHKVHSKEEYSAWLKLYKKVVDTSATVYRTKNEDTEAAFDRAIEELMVFEAEHNIGRGEIA